jgi:hypothetical protein
VPDVSSPYRITLSPQAQRQVQTLPPRRRRSVEARLDKRLGELAADAGARQWVAADEAEADLRTSLAGQPAVTVHDALEHAERTLVVLAVEGLEA